MVFGGDHTYWISRHVAWLEFGPIAWCWVLPLDRLPALRLTEGLRLAAGALILMLCCYNVPISVWHTHDGTLAVSIGLVLCLGPSSGAKFAGFFLVGSAFLFKQGYVFMIPGALLLLDGWRRLRLWVAAALPGILGGLTLLVLGAVPFAIRQLGSRTELFSYGVMTYLVQWGLPAGITLGLVAMTLAFPRTAAGAGDGTTWEFPRSDGAVEIEPSRLLDFHDGDLTFTASVRPDAAAADADPAGSVIASKEGRWTVALLPGRRLEATITLDSRRPSTVTVDSGPLDWRPGEWHRIALTVFGQTQRTREAVFQLWSDAREIGHASANWPVAPSESGVSLGADGDGGRPFAGALRGVQFHVAPLIPEELRLLPAD